LKGNDTERRSRRNAWMEWRKKYSWRLIRKNVYRRRLRKVKSVLLFERDQGTMRWPVHSWVFISLLRPGHEILGYLMTVPNCIIYTVSIIPVIWKEFVVEGMWKEATYPHLWYNISVCSEDLRYSWKAFNHNKQSSVWYSNRNFNQKLSRKLIILLIQLGTRGSVVSVGSMLQAKTTP
jgi:hypothetical protein